MVGLIKVIKPRPWRARAFTEEIEKELRNQGRIVQGMYEKTTSTWSKKPKFKVTSHFAGNTGSVHVYTSDQRYRFLDFGTRTRWAVMSRDFSPKTTHRTIGSRGGSGRVVIRGRQAMMQRNIKPRRGIKAREFTLEISSRRRPFFFKQMRAAIARGKAKSVK